MRSTRHLCLILCACALLTAACNKPAPAPAPTPEYAPRLTPDKMPPGFTTITLGKTDEATLTALLGPPSERNADKAFGGDMSAMRNDKPAIALYWKSEASVRRTAARLQLPEAAIPAELAALKHRLPSSPPFSAYEQVSATFISRAEGQPPTLLSLEILQANPATPADPANPNPNKGLCAWLDATIGSDPAAVQCPGTNRVFGKNKGNVGGSYCAGDAEGTQNLFAECHPGGGSDKTLESLQLWLSAE
jgi:hypothetical protein